MNRPAPPVKAPAFVVPPEYRRLHKYLKERFADTLVLKFTEIEDLLGSGLPSLARLRSDWWSNPDAGSTPSPQACSWIQANRIATPNLSAQTVMFERGPA
jgi:hypothetical protein